MGAEDLIGAVFPDQIASAENLAGEREIPSHPLVQQAIDDCLNEAMDIAGLERLLRGIESARSGSIPTRLSGSAPDTDTQTVSAIILHTPAFSRPSSRTFSARRTAC